MSQKRNIAFILIIIVAIVGVVYFLIAKGFIPNSLKPKAEVRLNTQYLNPFKKESQYINPFDEYKNPFDVVRSNEENK